MRELAKATIWQNIVGEKQNDNLFVNFGTLFPCLSVVLEILEI